MPVTRVIILALFLLATGASVLAAKAGPDEAYFSKAWTSEDGLPENKVVGVAQTPDGYLWVATLGGLARFDGVRFRPFEAASAAGFATSAMRVLQTDREGRVWLAKEAGAVVCIADSGVKSWTTKDGLPGFEGARSIAEDSEGAIWVSYTKGTVARIQDGRVEILAPGNGPPSTGLCWFVSDEAGRLWFAQNGRVGIYRQGKFNTLLDLAPHYLRIAPARGGGIWICSGSQVLRFQEGGEPSTLGELTPRRGGVEPTAMLEDREGAVWVGTAADGLFRCDTNGVTSVGTSYQAISSLTEDREGSLWVGTRGGGLNRVRRRVVTVIGNADGLPFEGVQSICRDASGALWAVGQNNVLVRRQGDKWITPTLEDNVAGLRATCVAADARGTVWVGLERGGLYQWQEGKFKKLNPPSFSRRGAVRCLLAAACGDLWMAADSSDLDNVLYRLRDRKFTKFELPPGHRFVRAMTEDTAGNIWAGASDGMLVRVTGDVLTDETAKFPGYSIRCLHGAPDGSLWMGYAGFGAARLREGRLCRFSAEQGLPNRFISQILSDTHGGVWFAGNQGLFQVDAKEVDDVAAGRAARVQPVLYGRGEGLSSMQANFDYCPNTVSGPGGQLYFSMLTGLAEARTDRIRPNRLAPAVYVERVTADNRTFAAYQEGEAPSGNSATNAAPMELKVSSAGRELNLPPGLQQVEIEFTALSLVAPENVRFRYQLEGLDKGWVDAGARRAVQYTHIPPGKYHFKVTACNNDGVWNERGASLAIVVAPHFWETMWFNAMAAVVTFGTACGSVVLALRRRHRFQLQHIEQQRSLERERARIARDLHDDLGVGLTEIGLLGDLAGTPSASPETSRKYSREITGRARDLVGLLDEIVWAINPANDTSQSLSDYFFRYAQTLLHRASIRCRLEIIEPFPSCGLTSEQRHQLFLAFKEALNNIIRHSGATEVNVSLGAKGGRLTILLADNGHGFQVSAGEGSRDGLKGMQERLKRLGGSCEIVSTGSSGTSVRLSIPIEEPGKKL